MGVRRFCSICVLMILISFVVACQGSDEDTFLDEPLPVAAGQVTIGTGFDDAWGPIEERIIEAYTAQNSNITVERNPLEQGWQDNVTASPLSDVILGTAGDGYQTVAAEGALLNLDLVWRDAGLVESVPAAVRQAATVDNGQFMLPMSVSWVAIYYNLEIFAAAGLTAPETWTELLTACDVLSAQGETPIASGPPGWVGRLWFDMINLRVNGAAFVRQLQVGEASYQDPSVQLVFDYWTELIDAGCFGETFNTGASNTDAQTSVVRDSQGLLDRNQAAMTLVGSFQMADLPGIFMDQFGFFRFPIISDNIPLAEMIWPIGYGVPDGAPNVSEAMDFMAFAATTETQALVASQQGDFAVPGNFAVEASDLSEAQVEAVRLIGGAEDGVLPQFLISGFTTFQRTNLAFGIFLRQPERQQETIDLLEEIRLSQLSGQ